MTRRPIHDPQRRRWCLAAAAGALGTQAGCISLDLGSDSPARLQWALRDAAASPTEPLPAPRVDALLLQARPSHAVADTLSIAYSRQDQAYAFYQFASWTERPLRQVPRLLQQRLQARGTAAAVGQLGDPLRADWLLAVGVDELLHVVQPGGGMARVALTLALYDRRQRSQRALRRFDAQAPVAGENAAAAVQALSLALAQCFDQALPWLETALPVTPVATPDSSGRPAVSHTN